MKPIRAMKEFVALAGIISQALRRASPLAPGVQHLIQIERLASDAKRARRLHQRSSGFEARAKALRNAILAAGPR